jgi:fructokinase
MGNSPIIIFGEVLFDCFPDGNQVLGGAPFNVAWHLQAFGLSPLFISRIGEDLQGDRIASAMDDWGMILEGLQRDPEHPTGSVRVTIIDQEPYYQIVENSAYDFIEFVPLSLWQKGSLLYHGTLALRNTKTLATLQQIQASLAPAIFLDVNLRNPWWQPKTVAASLAQTTWLKLNQRELSLLVPQAPNFSQQLEYLFVHYPLTAITVTQGKAGAISITRDGNQQEIRPTATTSVIDTVGAGDAFSSVLILGIIQAWELKETLKRAQEFASAIIELQGATPQNRAFYQPFLKDWNLKKQS